MMEDRQTTELMGGAGVNLTRRESLALGTTGLVAVAATGATVLTSRASRAASPAPAKHAENLGMPWEEAYGYAQAVKVGDTIYLSGQLSHDAEGKMVAPAPLDAEGRIADYGNMGPQMAQAYANARILLERYGAGMDNVVEEVLYVTDMDAAFAVAGQVREEAYGRKPVVASTILVTPRLAFKDQLIEIKMIAKV
jgi:enamine deaminase RidA (YjgF/YER057c/UK114 family)